MHECKHLETVKIVESNIQECLECIKMGDTWVHLRLCTVCGNVGCCDNSKNKHATNHYKKTNHPVIKSQEKNEVWGYCYLEELYIERLEKELK